MGSGLNINVRYADLNHTIQVAWKHLTTALTAVRRWSKKMIKLLLAVIIVAVILLLIGITAFGILEAKSMEWETKTIIRKEDEDDRRRETPGHDDQEVS